MATLASQPVQPPRHIIRCSDADADELDTILAGPPIPRALPGDPSCAYLDHPIGKPWGFEVKVYEDASSEAWLLVLLPMTRTSLHAHARKATILACVDGTGQLMTGAGDVIALTAGTVVIIMPGARHCSSTATGMRLVEFECFNDKFDLARYDDLRRGRGSNYEPEDAARPSIEVVGELPRLAEVVAGPPRARLRQCCGRGRIWFAVEKGARLKARPAGLRTAISVQTGPLLRGELSVVTRDDVYDAVDRDLYLSVRISRPDSTPR